MVWLAFLLNNIIILIDAFNYMKYNLPIFSFLIDVYAGLKHLYLLLRL